VEEPGVSRHVGVEEQIALSSLAQNIRTFLEALLFSASHHQTSLLGRGACVSVWSAAAVSLPSTFDFHCGQLTY